MICLDLSFVYTCIGGTMANSPVPQSIIYTLISSITSAVNAPELHLHCIEGK